MTAAGSAVTAAVITLSAAPAAPAATAQASAGPAAAAAPATFRPIATLTSAAISQRQANYRTAHRMMPRFGWGKRQWTPLWKLWNRESGWNKYAENPYSGAYGIPQAVPGSKMASAATTGAPTPPPRSAGGCATSRAATGARASRGTTSWPTAGTEPPVHARIGHRWRGRQPGLVPESTWALEA